MPFSSTMKKRHKPIGVVQHTKYKWKRIEKQNCGRDDQKETSFQMLRKWHPLMERYTVN